ncbi:MAG TPA: LysR family transcriptional regulator [Alphaproteobacteria bacterium]|jgi:DNA-binding transcriptional LysR family regulator|nr:LysR family transcriptional regulator [Alphaproteobacteria bacterium]
MDWDKLRVFHAVGEAGSFTHAGEVLNLSQSAVSRQISALEESLGVPLFHRHARGLILTEQGELLYQTTRDVFSRLAAVQSMLSESTEKPTGPLRITTTIAFGSIWLTPRMKEFLDAYPDIGVSLILTDGEVDLAMREADVAVRMSPPREADLIQRRLMTMHLHVYASPEYLKRHSTPKQPADLVDHFIIFYGEETRPPVTNINWLQDLTRGKNRSSSQLLKVNSIYGMYRAAQSGLGIAALPDYIVGKHSNLVRILPELEGPSFDTYFVYPEELRNSKRVAVFREFLLRKIAETPF